VETVISVLKRRYGSAVRSRVWWRQFRELVALCLVYNLERAVRVGIVLFALGQLLSQGLQSLKQRISTEPRDSMSWGLDGARKACDLLPSPLSAILLEKTKAFGSSLCKECALGRC